MVRNKSYSWKKVDQSKFQVKFQSGSTIDNDSVFEIDDNTGIMSAAIPLFSRIHTVQVIGNMVKFCDCYFFESVGIFVHIWYVYASLWQMQIMKFHWFHS